VLSGDDAVTLRNCFGRGGSYFRSLERNPAEIVAIERVALARLGQAENCRKYLPLMQATLLSRAAAGFRFELRK